ncbi:MAG: hypothetical protein ACT4PJ_17885 [Gemmatimonadaceae bacterium]
MRVFPQHREAPEALTGPANVRREPVPSARAILWKPLPDSYHLLASMMRSNEHQVQVFITQRAFLQVDRHLRSAPDLELGGFLAGHLYECPRTHARYSVINTIVPFADVTGDPIGSRVTPEGFKAVRRRLDAHRLMLIGWYRNGSGLGLQILPDDVETHLEYFSAAWQTTMLVVPDPVTPKGAFFTYDPRVGRSYCIPFYELFDANAAEANRLNRTCVGWTTYVPSVPVQPLQTADRELVETIVMPLRTEPEPEPPEPIDEWWDAIKDPWVRLKGVARNAMPERRARNEVEETPPPARVAPPPPPIAPPVATSPIPSRPEPARQAASHPVPPFVAPVRPTPVKQAPVVASAPPLPSPVRSESVRVEARPEPVRPEPVRDEPIRVEPPRAVASRPPAPPQPSKPARPTPKPQLNAAPTRTPVASQSTARKAPPPRTNGVSPAAPTNATIALPPNFHEDAVRWQRRRRIGLAVAAVSFIAVIALSSMRSRPQQVAQAATSTTSANGAAAPATSQNGAGHEAIPLGAAVDSLSGAIAYYRDIEDDHREGLVGCRVLDRAYVLVDRARTRVDSSRTRLTGRLDAADSIRVSMLAAEYTHLAQTYRRSGCRS